MSNLNQGSKPQRIVAELGRPETPDETAARKAENSRAHRANQTTRNLILALLASLAVVLFVVLVVIRPDNTSVKYVNYRSVAASAQPSVSQPLVAPALPATWKSNSAVLKDGDGDGTTWYVGLITPKQQFIAIEEGISTGDTWFGSLLGKAQPTGHATIAGVRWTIYDQRTTADSGNFQYSLTATVAHIHFVLHGSAAGTAHVPAEYAQVATGVAQFLTDAGQKVS
jgi:hypothetical protein